MTDFKKYVDLLNKIDLCDDEYYNNDKKIISDQEYDGLKDQLKSILPGLMIDSSSQALDLVTRICQAVKRVGAPPPTDGKWPKVQHEMQMGSLNKCNTPEELAVWIKKCNI